MYHLFLSSGSAEELRWTLSIIRNTLLVIISLQYTHFIYKRSLPTLYYSIKVKSSSVSSLMMTFTSSMDRDHTFFNLDLNEMNDVTLRCWTCLETTWECRMSQQNVLMENPKFAFHKCDNFLLILSHSWTRTSRY